jgi:hypothetical protein
MALDLILFAEDEDVGRVVTFPSEKNPRHLFKVGHFRSRNKPEGFNRYMKKACGETFMSIFNPPRGILRDAKFYATNCDYTRPPIDWQRAKERIREVKQKIDAVVKGPDEKRGVLGFFFGKRRAPNDPTEGEVLFYQQALEVIEDTIDYVLARFGDGKDYRLVWIEEPEKWDKIDGPY